MPADPKAPRPQPHRNDLLFADCAKGAGTRPLFHIGEFIVEAGLIGYITGMVSEAQRIVLVDHARLPWRFFGRLTAVQAGL